MNSIVPPQKTAPGDSAAPVLDIKPSILVVDDDESMRELVGSILKKEYRVFKAANLREGRRLLQDHEIQLVLLDIQLAGEDGLSLLSEIKQMNEQIEVIVITVVRDIRTAVAAIQLGAFDYLNKDFDYEELRALVAKALEKQQAAKELLYLREEIEQRLNIGFLIGRSPGMLKIQEVADRVAPLPSTVLITGETGTGKELLARYIHRKSHLADKPFVTVNIAAIHAELMESTLFGHERGAFTGAHRLHYGKFELAHGGTLFLDEIGELRFDLQTRLLRVLQENEIERLGGNHTIPVQVRLIAATNADLKAKVAAREFREDLFYRLNVVPIHLPPLRERREDIPALMRLFLERYSRQLNRPVKMFEAEMEEILMACQWPGNIRELENLVERMVALANRDTLGVANLPLEYHLYKVAQGNDSDRAASLQKAIDAFERNFILRVLEESSWNQTLSSEKLGIHRKTLEYKIKRLSLGEVIGGVRHNKVGWKETLS